MNLTTDAKPLLDLVRRERAEVLDPLSSRVAVLERAAPGGGDATSPTIVVAPSGADDQVAINQAVDHAVANGIGCIELTSGEFNLTAPILLTTPLWLRGQWGRTRLRSRGITRAAGHATEPALIANRDRGDHLMRVSDLWLDGNWSAGGTAHGIGFRCAGGSGYRRADPDMNPDPDIHVHDLVVTNFAGGERNAVLMDTDCRGTIIDRLQVRTCWAGVWMKDSPDSHISNVHIGGAYTAFYTTGGNVKFLSCKAFYSGTGFHIASGRGSLTGCEVQDSETGYLLEARDVAAASLVADTCRDDSIVIAADDVAIGSFVAFNRGNGRYGTTARGVRFEGSRRRVNVLGSVRNVQTPVSGTDPQGSNVLIAR